MLYRTSDSYHLTGEDARELYNALISPSREQRERNAECMRCIDESIHLGESDDNGFNVIIDDLDLSFLDDSVEDYSFDVNSSMTIKKRQWPVEFTDAQGGVLTPYFIDIENTFSESNKSQYTPMAA